DELEGEEQLALAPGGAPGGAVLLLVARAQRVPELFVQALAHGSSFPGFMIPSGSSARLRPWTIRRASPSCSASARALSSPTPWWWLTVAPDASAAAIAAFHSSS